MDPLSLTASIVAVLGVAGTLVNTVLKIAALQNAPKDISRLAAELDNLRRILAGIVDALRENPALDHDISSSCSTTTELAKDDLEQLRNLLNLCIRAKPGIDEVQLDWIAYARSRSKIDTIRQALHSRRLDLTLCLGSLNL
jgi:ABC-type transporter Mla subunit MlaD